MCCRRARQAHVDFVFGTLPAAQAEQLRSRGAFGDIIAQTCIEKKGFDWFRLFRLSSFGFLIHGSTSHYFYGFLDGKIPGATAPLVAAKVFIDYFIVRAVTRDSKALACGWCHLRSFALHHVVALHL